MRWLGLLTSQSWLNRPTSLVAHFKSHALVKRHTTMILRICFIVLCLLTSLNSSVRGQAKSASRPAGSISGTVTLSGKPLAEIGVVVRRSESGNPFERFPSAITDQRGGYNIKNLPSGIFEVQPSGPAYVAPDAGRSKTVVLSAGENVESVDFSLELGGVVTGKVKDSDGRPAIQQQVNLYFADMPPGAELFAVATATTDDRGVYRIFGVRKGRYKVAIGRSDTAFSTGLSNILPFYLQVFYPNVTDPAKAEIVAVTDGSEATGIDITVNARINTYTAKGQTVDGRTGLPIPHVSFGLVRLKGERFEQLNELIASNSQGEFIVEGLIPGKYLTFLKIEPNGNLRSEATTFEVSNSDVENVTVKLTKGASVSGVIALESADQAAIAKLSRMEVRGQILSSAGPFGAGQLATSNVGPSGTFQLAGLSSGTLSLTLIDGRDTITPNGFFIARVEREGVLQMQGLEIKEGEDITGVRLVVGYGSATLRGIVNLENGSLPSGGRIVVRLNKVGDTSNSIRPPRVDTRGHFLMENLPGGAYELTGSVSVSGKTKATVKRQLNLQDGTANDVTITIDLRPATDNTP